MDLSCFGMRYGVLQYLEHPFALVLFFAVIAVVVQKDMSAVGLIVSHGPTLLLLLPSILQFDEGAVVSHVWKYFDGVSSMTLFLIGFQRPCLRALM